MAPAVEQEVPAPRVDERLGGDPEEAPASRGGVVLAASLTVVVPVLAFLPALLGFVNYQPQAKSSGIAYVTRTGYLLGPAFIDPNVGYNSQAIGHAAALMWLHGHVPWWNLRAGLGMPLTASVQSAAWLPFTLLQALPSGSMWFHLVLTIVIGLATFALLRELRCSPLAAAVGAIAFELNGATTWLTNAPANPVPFLPLCLLGVEYVVASAGQRRRGGWLILAAGVWLTIVAGFPEVAALNLGLVAAWAIVRMVQHHRVALGIAWRGALGVLAGVLVAAPVLNAFVRLYKNGDVGLHVNALSGLTLPKAGAAQFVSPYLFGSIFDNVTPVITETWARIGGYAGVMLLVLAVGGLLGVRRGGRQVWIRLLTAAWALVFLGSAFNLPVLHNIVTHVPGLTHMAVYRYATASALLCLCILAALCIDDLRRLRPYQAALRLVPGMVLTLVCFCVGFFGTSTGRAWTDRYLPKWYWGSIALFCGILLLLAAAMVASVFILGSRQKPAKGTMLATVCSILLVVELLGFFEVPMLSWPRAVHYDTKPVAWLASHLGTQRYFTVGPLSPNYGTYYGVAQLDAADLPIPKNWSAFVHEKLNTCELPWQFGNGGPDLCTTSPLVEFLTNSSNYEAAGVKYFLLGTQTNILPYFQPRLDVSHQTPDGGAVLVLTWGAPSYFPLGVVRSMSLDLHGLPAGLAVRACSGGQCVAANPTGPGLNGEAFTFARPLTLHSALSVQLTSSAVNPVEIITTPDTPGAPASVTADGTLLQSCMLVKKSRVCTGRTAVATFQYLPHSLPVLVHKTKSTQIFLMPHFSPIATAPGCLITAHSMTSFTARCRHTAPLTYRELAYEGWAATINGHPVRITKVSSVYQRVELPAGTSTVAFSYAPPDALYTWLAALLGVLLVLGCVVRRLLGWTPPPPAPVGTFVTASGRPVTGAVPATPLVAPVGPAARAEPPRSIVLTPPAPTPAEVGSRPAEVGSRPAEVGSRPAEVGSRPAEVGSTPAEVGSTPAEVGSTPAEVGSTPAEVGSTPAEAAAPAEAGTPNETQTVASPEPGGVPGPAAPSPDDES